jgi:hypothetical protein
MFKKIVTTAYRSLKGKTFELLLQNELKDCGTLLDIGCGKNSPVKQAIGRGYSIGLDGFKPYLLKSKKAKIHDDYVLASLDHLCFSPKSFHTVVLIDVIEHLNKNDGYKLLSKMENLTKGKVLLFTPNGFLKQQEYDENDFQRHLSGWSVCELENQGFAVFGVNGFKFFLKEKAELKINQWWYYELDMLSESLAYRFPKTAFQLLAVKKLKN